jgi:hypothetical protein
MDKKTVNHLFDLISKYNQNVNSYPQIIKTQLEDPPKRFRSTNRKNWMGGFLLENSGGQQVWLLLLSWKKRKAPYCLVLFDTDKTTILAQIHEIAVKTNIKSLKWKYSPSKKSGDNAGRQKYFYKYYKTLDADIAIPNTDGEVGEFLDELLYLAELRTKADSCNEANPPEPRDIVQEGRLQVRSHSTRERDSTFIRLVKEEVLRREGKLCCECCDFDFEAVYGLRGRRFIEGHHLYALGERPDEGAETKKEDIALVCSNCHSMLHRHNYPWLLKDNLRELIKT